MGPASFVVFVAALAGLVVVVFKLNEVRRRQDDEDVSWALKLSAAACLLALIVSGVWAVDSYLVDVETPFDPPEVEEMPEHPREVEAPAPLELDAEDPRPKMDEVLQEHRGKLDDFEENAGR